MKFDGCKVKETVFNELPLFALFFTDNGDGYCKSGPTTCNNDYSLAPIQVAPDSIVWIKNV